MTRPALAAALLLAAAPALAQDRPPLQPTRDVAVTYQVLGQDLKPMQGRGPMATNGISIAWSASTGLMRTEVAGMGYMVADQRQGKAFMVIEAMHAIMDIPFGQAALQHGMSPNATFRREGTATVAGLTCTIWAMQDGDRTGRACVTGDGVMLRAEGTSQGRTGGMEATQVNYGPQDPARFQRPQGYQAMQLPQGVPPGMGPGAGPGPNGLPPGARGPSAVPR